MKNTEKLYDRDAYLTEFTAAVLSCAPCAQGYDIILERTLFFPEEGGQSCDTGTINGNPVTDVRLVDGIIHHTLSVPFPVGSEVNGEIDWSGRFSNMQQHSGEHILSGLVHSLFGFNNVGFHLGSQAVTLDFDGYLEADRLTMLETLANEAIYRNVEIQACYPSPEILSGLSYRSKMEIDGPVRIVTIEGYDVCACCAPHVRHTGEIGILKIVDAVRYKGGSRISILCGSRALADYRKKQEEVSAVSVLLSAKPECISDAVSRQKEDIYSLKGKLAGLTDALVKERAASLPENTDSVCLFEPDFSPQAHRNYCNLLVKRCSGVCAVFVGGDESGYRYILCGNGNLQALNEQLKNTFHAKGGGREMIQGSLTAERKEIEALFQAFLKQQTKSGKYPAEN